MTTLPQGIVFIIITIAVALLVVDQLALWMQRRRWIRWRKPTPPPAGGGGTAGLLTQFQQLVEPQVRHVIQDRDERRLGRLSVSADGRDKRRSDPDT